MKKNKEKELIFDFIKADIISTKVLIEKVTEVHEKLFPDATLQSQCDKFDEEYKEFEKSDSMLEAFSELADMIIVCCGIRRFAVTVGESIISDLLRKANEDGIIDEVCTLVCEKMNTNQLRVWNKNDEGYYKHISNIN